MIKQPDSKPTTNRWQLTGEAVVIALACVIGVFPLILITRGAITDDQVWSGSIGWIQDSQQYLAWIADSAHHLLVGNLYSLAEPNRVYLNPGILISGLLHRAGLTAAVAYAVWIPIGLISICLGAVLYVRNRIASPAQRVVALTLGLLYAFPLYLIFSELPRGGLAGFGLAAVSEESRTLSALWGYQYSAVPIGLVCFAMLAYARASRAGRRFSPAVALLTLAACWLQPWQGIIIAAAAIGSELVIRTAIVPTELRKSLRSNGWQLAATTALAALLPVIYYWALGRFDLSFATTDTNQEFSSLSQSWWILLLIAAPLLLPAVAAVRLPRDAEIGDVLLRAWPISAIGFALLLSVTGIASEPAHAYRGIAIPLAILAVIGASRLVQNRPKPLAAILAAVSIILLCGLGSFHALQTQVTNIDHKPNGDGAFVQPNEQQALDWIASQDRRIGVLASNRIAPIVPGATAHQVWSGNWTWTPNYAARFAAVGLVTSGAPCCQVGLLSMPSPRFAQATGAGLLLIDCDVNATEVLKELAPAISRTQRFGCAAVAELLPGSKADRDAVTATFG